MNTRQVCSNCSGELVEYQCALLCERCQILHERRSPEYQMKPKAFYRERFHGSERLFTACWREYRRMLASDIDAPQADTDVLIWLDELASERVNSGRSPFYIYG